MGYYESVFSKVDYRLWIVLIPIIGLLMIYPALNIPLGIDFTGGTEIQALIPVALTAQQVNSALSPCTQGGELNVKIGELNGETSVIARTKDQMNKTCALNAFSSLGISDEETSRIMVSTYKPELGKTLMEQGIWAVTAAAILMIIIVFIAFRSLVPSIAVIQAAFFDILIALGILSLFGFELNLAGVAALLMLIGYSIDTDIMLTSKLLKESGGESAKKINDAFSTGITMTGTTLGAMAAIFIVTMFVEMPSISQIATVLLVGLTIDLATTWLTNLAILLWYVRRKKPASTKKRFNFSLFRS